MVVVTGAALAGSTGLLRCLVSEGGSVVLCATKEMNARLKKVQREFPGAKVAAMAVPWWDKRAVVRTIEAILLRFGRVDALVHIGPEHAGLTPRDDAMAERLIRDDGWPQGLAIYCAEEPLGTEVDVAGRKDGPRRVVMGCLGANGRPQPAAASRASAICAEHFLRQSRPV